MLTPTQQAAAEKRAMYVTAKELAAVKAALALNQLAVVEAPVSQELDRFNIACTDAANATTAATTSVAAANVTGAYDKTKWDAVVATGNDVAKWHAAKTLADSLLVAATTCLTAANLAKSTADDAKAKALNCSNNMTNVLDANDKVNSAIRIVERATSVVTTRSTAVRTQQTGLAAATTRQTTATNIARFVPRYAGQFYATISGQSIATNARRADLKINNLQNSNTEDVTISGVSITGARFTMRSSEYKSIEGVKTYELYVSLKDGNIIMHNIKNISTAELKNFDMTSTLLIQGTCKNSDTRLRTTGSDLQIRYQNVTGSEGYNLISGGNGMGDSTIIPYIGAVGGLFPNMGNGTPFIQLTTYTESTRGEGASGTFYDTAFPPNSTDPQKNYQRFMLIKSRYAGAVSNLRIYFHTCFTDIYAKVS